MSTVHPFHAVRTIQAREEGYRAGQVWAETAAKTCAPDEWTPEAQTEWCDMLRFLAENPYAVDQQPYTDATDSQNFYYHQQWEVAFKQGTHQAQAELRRAAA